MEVVRKTATITPTGSETDFPGTFEVILSAPTKDRDGDTLLPEEWKQPLPEHITFDIDHGMSVATTVGSGVPSIDAKTGNLVVRGTYSSLDRAQEVRTLVNEGHIRTTSVAFMNEPATVKNGKKVNQRELLNGAFVAVPSNREAVITNSKGIDLKYSPDQERDENGRFAGGSTGGTDLTPSVSYQIAKQNLSTIKETISTDMYDAKINAHQILDTVGALASDNAVPERAISEIEKAIQLVDDTYSRIDDGKYSSALENIRQADRNVFSAQSRIMEAADKGDISMTPLQIQFVNEAANGFYESTSGMSANLRSLEEAQAAMDAHKIPKSLDDYSTKSSSDSSNIGSDVSEEAKSAEEVLKAAASIAAAIEADSAEDADSVTLKAQAMNIIVEAFTSEN